MTKLAPVAPASAFLAFLAFAGGAAAQDFPKDLSAEAIGAWAPGHTTLKPGDLVSVGGGRLVAVVDRRPDPTDAALTRITVRTEIVEAAAAKSAGGLSEAQDLVLDCRARTAKAGPVRVHAQRNLAGAARTQPGWDQWTGGEPASVLGRIIDAGCRRAMAADPLLGAAFAKPATVGPPKPVEPGAELPPLAAAPAPEPTPAVEAPKPAAEAPAPPMDSAPAEPAPRPAADAPSPAPAAPARTGLRNLFVQVAAAGSQGDAEAAIAKAQADLPELFGDRPSSVEATVVGVQTFYRALFGGFATVEEAKQVCKTAQARGRDCLLRVK